MIDEEKKEKLLNKLSKQIERENCPKTLNLANKILKVDPKNMDVLKIKLTT